MCIVYFDPSCIIELLENLVTVELSFLLYTRKVKQSFLSGGMNKVTCIFLVRKLRAFVNTCTTKVAKYFVIFAGHQKNIESRDLLLFSTIRCSHKVLHVEFCQCVPYCHKKLKSKYESSEQKYCLYNNILYLYCY